MSQEQNYQVSYDINVNVSEGATKLTKFAEDVQKLSLARIDASTTVESIKTMMSDIDAIFKTNGKKDDRKYKFTIDTAQTNRKLNTIKKTLGEIKESAKGIKLVINPGKPLQSTQIKANAQKALQDQQLQRSQIQKTAATAAKGVLDQQQMITRAVGKINAAMISIERRELNIKTEGTQKRLQGIVSLLNQIRTLSGNIPMVMGAAAKRNPKQSAVPLNRTPAPFAPGTLFYDPRHTKRAAEERKRQEQFERGIQNFRNRTAQFENTAYSNRRRAAINRLQYSRPPSIRRMMPYAYMLNGYMLFSTMKRELTKAVEYANIMQSAESILKVADTDLSTFEDRFMAMARTVRQVGVETKFTAVEVAGAVKYLAMAGQSIDSINKSIRPIANLALIGDNDLSQIADLVTNVMAGYDIKPDSMGSVADIIASTISRSNVNIIETAESFKMSAGFLRSAGVEFTEAAAAIGLLGNMGVKGTMAGTSLRAMATRFAKPPKEAQKVLDRYGVKFTRYEDVYGKQVERLKPLADIFEELNRKGATLGDMHAIFGKIGGNAAMMLLRNYDKLREQTDKNKISHGISGDLAEVKQNTTKGLWYQVTSRLSETFMQGYEVMEPQIQQLLKGFLEKFRAPEFAQGLASIGGALLDIMRVLANMATWFARNFTWLEPVLFTGFVATKLFKLAGAVTNLGVALGFLGKQSAAATSMQLLSSLVGAGIPMNLKGLTFGNKRVLVQTMQGMGIAGKGAYTKALGTMGQKAVGQVAGRGAATGLFATQVATGRGLVGAGASIGALGAGAIAATAGLGLLAGALAYVGYQAWKTKEISEAALEELAANRKYRYPSIEALYTSLDNTYKKALQTRDAVENLVNHDQQLSEVTGHKIGRGSRIFWRTVGDWVKYSTLPIESKVHVPVPDDFETAYQKSIIESIRVFSEQEGQKRLNSVFAEMGKLSDPTQVGGFIRTLNSKYGADASDLDESLFTITEDGTVHYVKGLRKNLTVGQAFNTPHFQDAMNKEFVPQMTIVAQEYQKILTSAFDAQMYLKNSGFDFTAFRKLGFGQDKSLHWYQRPLSENATEEEREKHYANYQMARHQLVTLATGLRDIWGGSENIAMNIMRAAGFDPALFSNEPQQEDPKPWDANGITFSGADDGGAGGNYSGTGKLSSSAPKQVIVTIGNLLSVDTIDLMKSPEGQKVEIQNLKEQLAQALIDTVHDFDASWNG